jgi:hypothetical protein
VAGECSGSQIAGSRPAGTPGSWTKPQPPALGESGPDLVRIDSATGNLAEGTRIIPAIAGIAAEKLDGKAGPVEEIELLDGFG